MAKKPKAIKFASLSKVLDSSFFVSNCKFSKRIVLMFAGQDDDFSSVFKKYDDRLSEYIDGVREKVGRFIKKHLSIEKKKKMSHINTNEWEKQVERADAKIKKIKDDTTKKRKDVKEDASDASEREEEEEVVDTPKSPKESKDEKVDSLIKYNGPTIKDAEVEDDEEEDDVPVAVQSVRKIQSICSYIKDKSANGDVIVESGSAQVSIKDIFLDPETGKIKIIMSQ